MGPTSRWGQRRISAGDVALARRAYLLQGGVTYEIASAEFLSEQRDCGRRVVFAAASKRDLRAMDRRAGVASTQCAD